MLAYCAGRIPQRWVMTVLGMLGVTMAYVMRACLGITLTQMVKPVIVDLEKALSSEHNYCPVPETTHSHKDNKTAADHSHEFDYIDRFDWDEESQGQVLAAFYYGYLITHLPGGVLAQKFGGKYIMGLSVLSTAVFTLLTPTVAHMGSTALIILRFVEGLGEVSSLWLFIILDLLDEIYVNDRGKGRNEDQGSLKK